MAKLNVKKIASTLIGNGLIFTLASSIISRFSSNTAKQIYKLQVGESLPKSDEKLEGNRQWQSVILTTLLTAIISSLLKLFFMQFYLRVRDYLDADKA